MIVKKHSGFTLIELMIVVAIIAILAAVAIPSYNSYIQKTRRADAKVALTHAAAQQERFYMRHNAYAGNLSDIGGTGGMLHSPEGYYSLSVSIEGCPNGQPNGSCFVLTAEPTAKANQDNDVHCAQFTLRDTGKREATSADCW